MGRDWASSNKIEEMDEADVLNIVQGLSEPLNGLICFIDDSAFVILPGGVDQKKLRQTLNGWISMGYYVGGVLI